MKAVIMAGGGGTRLRPLTCKTPKPMTEIATLPTICHIIRLLKRHGVSEAAVTTCYLADKTQAVGSEYDGVKLKYFRENSPLGTAGSVKNAARGYNDDFIVISGDCICDFDLTKAVEFHKAKRAACTVVLAERADPTEYGTVICDGDGKIRRFIEKPAWSQVFTDNVNTGIYVINPEALRLIADGVFTDFARDVFPRLLGGRLYGFKSDGYWCDVGRIGDYYRCNFDAAHGKIRQINKIPLSDGSIIAAGCRVAGRVTDSILHRGVTVGEGSRLEGCIVCENAVIGRNVTVGRGAVIGADCTIGDGCRVGDGVKIYADAKIPERSVIMKDITSKNDSAPLFTDSGICGGINDSLSPEKCFGLGVGCVIRAAARVGVMCAENGSTVSETVKSCLLCGVSHGGGVPFDFGAGTPQMSAFAAMAYRQDVLLHVECGGDKVKIRPVGKDSLTLCAETERKITSRENASKRGEYLENPVRITGVRELYISSLMRAKAPMKGLKCAVSDTSAGSVLAEALNALGADVRLCRNVGLIAAKGENRLCFEIDDADLRLYAGEKFTADFEHIRACIVHHKAPSFKNVALPYSAPAVLDDIARRRGARVFRYLTTPSGGGDVGARTVAADYSQLIFRDVCFMAMQICEMLAEMNFDAAKLQKSFEELPSFANQARDIEYDDAKRAELMRHIVTDPSPATEGAQLIFSGGRALVIPKRSGGFRIIAEAVNTEAAREISFKTERKLYGKDEE